MKRVLPVVFTLLVCLVLSAGTVAASAPLGPASHVPAQSTPTVTVNTARPVTDVIGEKSAYLASVSPDGNYIAWGKQTGRGKDRMLQLCVFEFDTAGKQCSDLSPDVFDGYPYQLQWSPDSRYIAFSENPTTMASESDIWVFDREAQTFTNLTDDGLVGIWGYLQSDGAQVVLDYLPMWNAADNQIYFWRVTPLGNMRYTIGIYRVAPTGGDAELVRDLTVNFAASLPLFAPEEIFLDGTWAIAPDGNTAAVIMTTFTDMGAAEQALWTIDLTDPKAAPTQLAGVDALQSGLPDWAKDFPPQVQGLSWTADGQGIVAVANSEVSATMPFQVYYYVDPADATVTPIVDFSAVEDMDTYFEPAPESDLPWRAYSPWTASLSPEGDKLLMVNDLGGTVALFTAPLPPDGALPVVSAGKDTSPVAGSAASSRGEGGKVIAYGLLLDIAEAPAP